MLIIEEESVIFLSQKTVQQYLEISYENTNICFLLLCQLNFDLESYNYYCIRPYKAGR